jgi:hypothetical protein
MTSFFTPRRFPTFWLLLWLLSGCASLALGEHEQRALNALEHDISHLRQQIETRVSATPDSQLRDSLSVLDSILEFTARVKADPARFDSEQLRLYQQKIAIINENIERFSDLTLQADVSFPPGAHTLESLSRYGREKNDQLVTKLSETVRDLAEKYPGQRIRVTLKTIGHTDETPVLAGSALEKEILATLSEPPPADAISRRILFNEVLSRFRADSISRYVSASLQAALPGELDNIDLHTRIIGRGETPPSDAHAYGRNDARRRICIVSPFIEVIP